MIYLLGSLIAPLWGWLYTASCRLSNPHARAWSRPRPLKQFSRGRRTARCGGRHRLTGVTV